MYRDSTCYSDFWRAYQAISKSRSPEVEPLPAENQWISHIRVLVEHSIGGVKVYRIVHEVIRHWCPYIRDQVMAICCGLYNLRLRQQLAVENASES